VCLVRGLASPIEPWLADEIRRHLAAPLGDAVDGALQLARNAAQSPLHRGATPSRRQR
jgi:glucosamine kinase